MRQQPKSPRMDISSVSSNLLNQIGNSATQTGDAVTISVMRKAMDIQAQQAMTLIESAKASAPKPGAGPGQIVDTFA